MQKGLEEKEKDFINVSFVSLEPKQVMFVLMYYFCERWKRTIFNPHCFDKNMYFLVITFYRLTLCRQYKVAYKI